MKIYSSFLPILAISAKKRKKNVERGERSFGRKSSFRVSSYYRQCSDQIRAKGGTFETPDDGLRGQVKLENYPNHIKCNHVIQAADSCSAIRVTYQSIAVEDDHKCQSDFFRFGWSGPNGFNVTPPRCDCFGDGCDSLTEYGYGTWQDYSVDYTGLEDYGYTWTHGNLADTDGFSVNLNTFTFYFRSDNYFPGGHVIFDWECVDQEVTTQAPGTQGGVTTTQPETITYPKWTTTTTTTTTT